MIRIVHIWQGSGLCGGWTGPYLLTRNQMVFVFLDETDV